MHRLAILIVLTVTMLMFTACQDRPEDITQSIEKQHMRGTDGIEPLHPSNKDQNKARRDVTENAVSYASEFGYYLNQLYAHLEPLNNLFYTENPTAQDVHEAQEHVQNAQDWSEYIVSLDTPPEFVNLYIGHSSTLLELDSLMKSLEDMDLNNEVDFRRARLYYENTIIAVKSMEREYKGVLEEHGIK